MKIRKLVDSVYDQVIELYIQLEEYHAKARPDCFVHREKDEVYPKEAFVHDLTSPDGLELGAFDNELLIGTGSATLWEKALRSRMSRLFAWITSMCCPAIAAEESLQSSLQK